MAVLLPPERGLDGDGVVKKFFVNDAHLLVVGFVLDFGEGGVFETSLDVIWLRVGDDGHVCVHG